MTTEIVNRKKATKASITSSVHTVYISFAFLPLHGSPCSGSRSVAHTHSHHLLITVIEQLWFYRNYWYNCLG